MTGNKFALLVAVDVAGLEACKYDAEYMKEALVKKGFKEENISLLFDEAATLEGIIKVFQEKLIDRAKPGDIVVFYFSGHGQQIPDDEENPDEMDLKDESLVPYDFEDKDRPRLRDDKLEELLATLSDNMRGTGGNVEGDIVVILDSCHSGTATRGTGISKSLPWDKEYFGEEPVVTGRGEENSFSGIDREGNYLVFAACKTTQTAIQCNGISVFTCYFIKALDRAGSDTTYFDLYKSLSRMVSSAGWEQNPQMEGNGGREIFAGTFESREPYYIVEPVEYEITDLSLEKLKYEMSWFSLDKNGKDSLKDKLSPEKYKKINYLNFLFSGNLLAGYLEKDEVEMVLNYAHNKKLELLTPLLNRKFSESKLRNVLKNLKFGEDENDEINTIINYSVIEYENLIEVPAGKLHGMTEGSLFAIYPYGSDLSNEDNIIGKCEILFVYMDTSIATIEGNIEKERVTDGKTVEIAHNFSETLRVYVEDGGKWWGSSGELNFLMTGNKSDYDIKIYNNEENGLVILENKDGNITGEIKAEEVDLPGKIYEKLLSEWRKRFLLNLSNDDLEINVRLVKADVETSRENESKVIREKGKALAIKPDENNEILIYEGDWATFEVSNLSETPVYITLFSMDFQGNYRPVFPDPESQSYEDILQGEYNKVPADGLWYRIPVKGPESFYKKFLWKIGEPFGNELIKVIATAEPVDFSPLVRPDMAADLANKGEDKILTDYINTRGEVNPLALLLLDIHDGRNRGDKAVDTSLWGTADLIFESKEK